MAMHERDDRQRAGWSRTALAALAGGVAAAGGYVVARRALTPPDERERQGDFPERTHTPEPFGQRYRQALANDRQRVGLLRFQRHWRNARDTAFAHYADSEEMGETYGQGPAPVGVAEGTGAAAHVAGATVRRGGTTFEAMRDELAATKDRVIADLPRFFTEFKDAAERGGATVYASASVEDANRYIADLCQRKGVTIVAKAKSMVSEETGLNPYLKERGIQVAETDLGEWLVQLADERPSHIIAPALHMDRFQTAELLSQATGQSLAPDDVGAQVGAARRWLRDEFLRAGLGVSGANALIAESGTVMLVTNEGNAELVTSLPAIHVVLAGYEKLLPTLADAMLQTRLLARSGTGQPISVYTTFITGPDRPGKEVHFVLVDNGRRAMAADPDFASALRCIRCGACADVCPPYQVVGGHAFGYIYSGAIGLVNTPFHHGLANGAGPQSLCVSCNACATVCPVGIDLPRQILDVRHKVVAEFGLPWYKRPLLELWSHPALFDRAARLAARLSRPLVDPQTNGAFVRKLPGAAPYQSWRSLPVPAAVPARDRLFSTASTAPVAPVNGSAAARTGTAAAPVLAPPLLHTGATGTTVAYFIQCLTDRLYPEMAEATVRVLQACGARVVVPVHQHCCGLPAFDSGDWERAKTMARATIAALDTTEATWVVTAGASCAVAIGHDYTQLFKDEPDWRDRAAALAARTLDLTSFLERVAQLPDGALTAPGGAPVTYHNFCQSHNVLGLNAAPRRLIRDVMGLDLVELPEAAVCCGFGGSVSSDHPQLAAHILARKLDNFDQTGVATLVTDNPGCIMHLRGGLDASGRTARVLHLVELLDERLHAKFPEAFAVEPTAVT